MDCLHTSLHLYRRRRPSLLPAAAVAVPGASAASFAASAAADPAFSLPETRPTLAKDSGINVGKYVAEGYTPYDGDASFLAGPSERTRALRAEVERLCSEELERGIMGVDPAVPSTITAFPAGYIDREREVVVGLQTDAPLKRAIKPLGGINMVKAALQARLLYTMSVLRGVCVCMMHNMFLRIERKHDDLG
jgi:formate C-acetyltransferase